jgi:hypothetical protein
MQERAGVRTGPFFMSNRQLGGRRQRKSKVRFGLRHRGARTRCDVERAGGAVCGAGRKRPRLTPVLNQAGPPRVGRGRSGGAPRTAASGGFRTFGSSATSADLPQVANRPWCMMQEPCNSVKGFPATKIVSISPNSHGDYRTWSVRAVHSLANIFLRRSTGRAGFRVSGFNGLMNPAASIPPSLAQTVEQVLVVLRSVVKRPVGNKS